MNRREYLRNLLNNYQGNLGGRKEIIIANIDLYDSSQIEEIINAVEAALKQREHVKAGQQDRILKEIKTENAIESHKEVTNRINEIKELEAIQRVKDDNEAEEILKELDNIL